MRVTSSLALALVGGLAAACFVDSGSGSGGVTGDATGGSGTTDTTSMSPTSVADASSGGTTVMTAPTTADPTTSSVESTGGCEGACCGDGMVDTNEQCDDGNSVEDDFCAKSCVRAAYRVFVTKQGSVLSGGLAEADDICQSAAATAGLPGVYRAWLSTSTVSAKDRVTHKQMLPIRRLDNQAVVTSAADLVSGGLLVPIAVSEAGEPLPLMPSCTKESAVWTGTLANGEPNADTNCGDWTTTMGGAGAAGFLAKTDVSWTDAGCAVACDGGLHLYCFEVDP